MKIDFRQTQYNISIRRSPIKYIVIHDTGNPREGADALAHFNYINGGDRGASADFFVDSERIVQINNYTKYYTWHCGDGDGMYGITNSNSIGIEICINPDGNYNIAVKKTIELTKHLMQKLNIPADRVVRHYDASRKNCPATMTKNNWAQWKDFKNRITESEGLSMTQYEELKKLIADSKEKVYHYTLDVPEYGRATIQKLLDKGYLKGESAADLNLPESMFRTLVILDRAGVFDK